MSSLHYDEDSRSSASSGPSIVSLTKNTPTNAKGIGWFITSFFLVANNAGVGIISLPQATVKLGLVFGIVFQIAVAITFTITGCMLGECWNVLLRSYEKYRTHCRKPYPAIAEHAMGMVAHVILSISINLSLFGSCVVFLLLIAQNVNDILKSIFDVSINYCLTILIISVLLIPLVLLDTPKDFWAALVFATVSTVLAVILICVGAIIDFGTCNPVMEPAHLQFSDMMGSLGTFFFSFAGHSSFPTIQHDMREPAKFSRSVVINYIILTIMYTPVCVLGYLTYGNSVRDSVITSIQTRWIRYTINILITLHCFLGFTITINPVCQQIEQWVNVPHGFNAKKVITRVGFVALLVFIAETIPTFGPLMDLVGGSCMALACVILPCVFYYYLSTWEERLDNSEIKNDERIAFIDMIRGTSTPMLVLGALICAFGLIAGVISTYSAVLEITSTNFQMPCYVQAIQGKLKTEINPMNCCGEYQNVTILSNFQCPSARPTH